MLSDKLLARSEVQRRGKYFEKLEDLIPYGRARLLVQLTKDCLCNAPSKRPTAEQLVTLLGGTREDNIEIITANRADVVTQTVLLWKRDTEVKEKHKKDLSRKDDNIQQLQQQLHDTKVNKKPMYGCMALINGLFIQCEYEANLSQKNAEIEQNSMQLQVYPT